jgi:hypothetical protein
MDDRDTRDSGTTDWLVGAARRNPEALLVIAAGCALLLRKGSSLMSNGSSHDEGEEDFDDESGTRDTKTAALSRAANTATEYLSDAADQVYETASDYASKAGSYAQQGGRQAARLSRRGQSVAGQVWREQPLAVVGLGLAAGAAIAAMLPPTRLEKRTFAPAGEALIEAAGRTAESVKEAAGEVAERLQGGAAEIGAAGMREIARDAAQTFVSSVSGNAGKRDEDRK